jgi:hypothetical protein
VIASCPCRLCGRQLEPAQQLRFHFETEARSNPTYLAMVRELPHVRGTPLRVCQGCQAQLEARPRLAHRAAPADRGDFRSAALAAVGVVAVGWVFRALLGSPRA